MKVKIKVEETINKKVAKATKWSTITEILAKLVVPITNLILARILAPEAFGILATVTMVTSFADMLADAGFQKYLIQHEFKNKEDLYKNANVAFMTNFFISIIAWILIIIFRNQISSFLGNPGLGMAITVASMQLPITALSSIQMALYKRTLDFKTLFYRRIIAVMLPFIVTIPLALLKLDYWSLIIGTLVGAIVNAIILTVKSEWKPRIFFKMTILKEMFSFSMWTLIDSVIIWLGMYIDTFILGNIFNDYYLGIYKNSTNIVNAMMNVITSSILPVLLAGLSRCQKNNVEYNKLLFRMQKLMSYLLIPMGVGIFLYQDFVTNILLGSQWKDAAQVIGIASLIAPIVILLSNCTSVCYISKGKPKLSILAQSLYLIPLIPLSLYMARVGFVEYVYVRQLFRIELVIVNLIILNYVIKIPILNMLKNLVKPLIATGIMAFLAILLKGISDSDVWNIFSIIVCILTYFGILYVIDKDAIKQLKQKFLKKEKNKSEKNGSTL